MKKIVELIIKLDDIELNGVGGDALAFVENPAIELDFLAFAKENFVEPSAGESQDDFISRCIPVLIEEGYEQDQAAAICYGYWEGAIDTGNLKPYVDQVGEPKKQEHSCEEDDVELNEMEKWILSECGNMGEEWDPMNTIFVDANRASFSTLTDFLKGIAALDILGKRGSDEAGETVYRYAGPTAQRGFCRAMLRLNKVYRPEEVAQLDSANPGFGEGGANNYSVLKYKGGPNCRHYWEQLTMFKRGGQTVFVSNGPVDAGSPGAPGMSATDKIAAGQSNNAASPSSNGAVGNNAWVNRQMFSIDDDKRIAIGPAMIPNKMIKRKDDNGNPYWVYFTEQTIRDVAEDYFKKYKQNNTNIEHNSDETHTRNTLLESWIVEDPKMDKSALYGFEVPKGSWMVSYKVNDDDTWKKIKSGELRGFSIEGYFLEKSEAKAAVEQTYSEILDILNQIK